MALIVMGSVKASPGVTTAALALCVAWPTPRWAVMIEADPAGGDLAARFGLAETPGVLSLAAASRHARNAEALFDHTQRLPVNVIVGPVGATQTRVAVGVLAGAARGGILMGGRGTVVVADVGRLDARSLPRFRGSPSPLTSTMPSAAWRSNSSIAPASWQTTTQLMSPRCGRPTPLRSPYHRWC